MVTNLSLSWRQFKAVQVGFLFTYILEKRVVYDGACISPLERKYDAMVKGIDFGVRRILIYSFTHSLNKHLLSCYYVLGSRMQQKKKKGQNVCPHVSIISMEELAKTRQINKQII